MRGIPLPISSCPAAGYYISTKLDTTVQAMSEQAMWAPSQARIEQANVTAFARRSIRR